MRKWAWKGAGSERRSAVASWHRPNSGLSCWVWPASLTLLSDGFPLKTSAVASFCAVKWNGSNDWADAVAIIENAVFLSVFYSRRGCLTWFGSRAVIDGFRGFEVGHIPQPPCWGGYTLAIAVTDAHTEFVLVVDPAVSAQKAAYVFTTHTHQTLSFSLLVII